MRLGDVFENKDLQELNLGKALDAVVSPVRKIQNTWRRSGELADLAKARAQANWNSPTSDTNVPNAEPNTAGTTLDTSQLAQQSADRLAQKQKDQQQAIKQMKATQRSNAQAEKARDKLVAAVKVAKSKPGFQQTLQDKNLIKQAAAKGIHEGEFYSKFLERLL